MKILHLHSNWKWTGPSEPILNLCRTLTKHGHSIWLGCIKSPPDVSETTLLKQAQDNGIKTLLLKRSAKLTAPIVLLKNIRIVRRFLIKNNRIKQPRSKFGGFNPLNPAAQRGEPRQRRVVRYGISIIHTHSSLDHFIAAQAVRKLSPRPGIIRTNHKGKPLEASRVNKWLINKYTDGYITLSNRLLAKDREAFGMAKERSWWIEGAIDIERLRPDHAGRDLRKKYGLHSAVASRQRRASRPYGRGSPQAAPQAGGEPRQGRDIVAGVVARIQRHRRFEVLLEAIDQAIKTVPQLKVLVVGRGTHQKKLLIEPVARMGLERNVIRAGYLRDDYIDTLKLLDFGIYLMPGSDGSCRAAREMMALGKPLIVSHHGILPELIQDGVNGLVRTDTAEPLAEAIIRLVKDRTLRERLGNSAQAKALAHFRLDHQADKVEEIYCSIQDGV